MLITRQWLTEHERCGIAMVGSFYDYGFHEAGVDLYRLIEIYTQMEEYSWVCLLIANALSPKQAIRFAWFGSHLALYEFEKISDSPAPRKALQMVHAWLRNPDSITYAKIRTAAINSYLAINAIDAIADPTINFFSISDVTFAVSYAVESINNRDIKVAAESVSFSAESKTIGKTIMLFGLKLLKKDTCVV